MTLALGMIDRLNAYVAVLVGGLLGVTLLSGFLQVLVRALLTGFGWNISAPWTEELARYALIWMVFLGAGVGCRKGQLIALEFVVRALPARLGIPLRFATILLSVAFFSLLIWVAVPFVALGQTELSPVMLIQKSLVYWAMPIGCGLMLLNSLALMAEALVTHQDIRDIVDQEGVD